MKFEEIVPWGRTLAEYRSMFGVSERDLNSKILGCGDGPASFNAEMFELGHSVVSIDPIYHFSSEQIEQRVRQAYEPIISQVRQNPDRYCWTIFGIGYEVQVRSVTYEFQKGANQMLKISRLLK